MEQFIQKFFEQGAIVIFMGVVIYFVWLEYKKEKRENLRLNEYILMREREFAEDRMEEQKQIIQEMNHVATVLNKHNELTEYEQRRKKT